MTNSTDFRLDETTRNMLIELVKGRRALYIDAGDRSLADLRDERQTLWNEVGEALNIPAEVCKVKFTTLKNNYYKNLRNDSVGAEMRQRLEFLDETAPWNRVQTERPARITQRRSTEKPARITKRRSTKRYRHDNEDSDSSIILVNTATTSESIAHSTAANSSASNGASNGVSNGVPNGQNSPNMQQFAKPTTNAENNNNNNSAELYQNGVSGSTAEKAMPQWTPYGGDVDDLTSFFKSMEQTTRKFNARLQVKVKRMISDIIYDAEEQWLNNTQI